MLDFKVITDSAALLTGRMSYLNQRHDVLVQNVAHIETPGYVGQDLRFEGFLDRESRSAAEVQFEPHFGLEKSADPAKANGNNISLEKEMAKMTDNSMQYMTAVEVLNKNLLLMRLSVADK